MPRRAAIKAVVFDLDDTLYIERQYVLSGYRAVGEFLRTQGPGRLSPSPSQPGAAVPRILSHPATAVPREQAASRQVGSAGSAGSASTLAGSADGERSPRENDYATWMWRRFLAGRRQAMFDAMNEHFSLGLSQADVQKLVKVYREHVPTIRPLSDVKPLLKRLRRAGLKLGLLTDGYLPAQRLKWAALELGDFFDERAVVFTEELGRAFWKPSPRGFRLIRHALGVGHEECVYVADNPAKDFLAPNKLGWLSVQWLRRGQVHSHNPAPEGGQPQATVHSANELLDALAPWS